MSENITKTHSRFSDEFLHDGWIFFRSSSSFSLNLSRVAAVKYSAITSIFTLDTGGYWWNTQYFVERYW